MTHYLRNTSGGWQVCESAGNDFFDEFFKVARSYAESEHGGDEPEAHPGQPSLKQRFSEFFERFDDEQLEALAAACGKLSYALEEGTRQYYKRSGDSSRAAAIMQLEAAIYFIGAFDCSDGTLTLPLQDLLLALMGLDAGAVAPIVQPRTRSNRAPDTISRKATQMYAAVTMQLWMDIGSNKRPAAEAVAKILGQAGITLKRTRSDESIIDWNTVAKWRDQVQKKIKQEPDSPFALTYKRILKEGREWLGYLRRNQVDNHEIRKRALDSLALFLARHGESYDPKVIDWEPDPSE
jgi:hypothetical protein